MDTGNKKEQENASGHGSTLFVSNLPYTATSVDLQTLFSDFAPVKSAFVVTEHGSGISKGVGYVSFALREDAQSAFETIEKDGITLVGRSLRIQWAENKKPRERADESDSPRKEVKSSKVHRQHHLRPVWDATAIRTIVVSGLPALIDSKVLWKKIRKYDGAEKLDWPTKSEAGEDDPTTAHVLFSTPSQAATAINKLHAHVYKGSLLSVALKKRLDNLSKSTTSHHPKPSTTETSERKKGKTAISAPSHSSRLIVRNIPFEVTEQDLRATFLPYGPIHSIHIPMDTSPNSSTDKPKEDPESSAVASAYSSARKPRTKGFAFVWMLSKKDAERAMEGCNGTVMKAGSAKKLAEDKQKKKKEKRLEEKRLREASRSKRAKGKDEDEEDVEMEDIEVEGGSEGEEKAREDDDQRAKQRVIAVDWALSKDRWEGEKAKIEAEQGDSGGNEKGSSDTESNSAEDGGDDDNIGVHESSSEAEDDEDDDRGDDEEVKVKPELPPPEKGTTVFIRNVPFDATEEELRTLFRSFGPLRYARITLDPSTGRSRGTGFACFWNKEDADRAVQQSELLRLETTGQPSTSITKKNPFSLPSILTPDPSSSLAQSLVLHGRTLDVVTAVTRDVAGRLKDENERARQKEDKRNMYLLREGVILPNSPAATDLPAIEVERRTSSFNARRTLLKSNPSLYISKTRLSVRQIPTFVTERMLRRLVSHGVKEFEEEVKGGLREGLTADELMAEPTLTIDDADDEPPTKKSKALDKSKAKRSGLTRQAKIVRQAERIDGLTGKGKSKGYGFVEVMKHADALRFLRWANCNPEVGGLLKEWWKDEVEWLLEDERKKEKAKSKAKDKGTQDEKESADDGRLKRLKEELERVKDVADGGMAKKLRGGLLIVEFSIENVQVVQRRNARQKEVLDKTPADSQMKTKDRKRKRDSEADDVQTTVSLSKSKKSRVNNETEQESSKAEKVLNPKTSNPIGSIIGRKRKERKSGKRG